MLGGKVRKWLPVLKSVNCHFEEAVRLRNLAVILLEKDSSRSFGMTNGDSGIYI